MSTETEAGAAATTPTENANAPATVGNEVSTKRPTTVFEYVESIKGQIERALPQHVTAERLTRVALTTIRTNKKLQQANISSLLGAIMTSAQLGLEPNTPMGQCYIIPYWNKRANSYDAQFQMGYKGLVELAHRSGAYRKLVARAVDEADGFDFAYGLDETLYHRPSPQPSGNTVYYYAMYELENGGKSFVVWSREQVEAHAQRYSKSYGKDDSPWKTAFDQMAKKTVLIDLLRYAPKSVEVAQAASADNLTYRVNPSDPDLTMEAEFDEVSE